MAIRSTSYISEHRKRRKKVRRYIFSTLAVFALYFLFLGGAWLIARSPLFQLQHITVEGNNVIASQDIITLLQADPSGRHNFFGNVLGWNNMLVWPGGLSSSQLGLIPQLAGVTIDKDYFSRTITVNVVERNPFGVWCFLPKGESVVLASSTSAGVEASSSVDSADSGSCYWFDNAGVLFEKATNTEGNLIVVVRDYSQSSRGLGQKVLPDAFAANFISVVNVLHSSNINIQELDLNDLSLEEVDAITSDGPEIYFSLRFPANDYLGVLQSLVSQGGFSKLQYVDCRTEDRVYYK
jgi:hypothetical protein